MPDNVEPAGSIPPDDRQHTVTCRIDAIDHDPLQITTPIVAVLIRSESGFTALFEHANLGASGGIELEAIEGLEDRIITTFERMTVKRDDQLVPVPLRRKRILTGLIRRCQ